MNVELQTFSVIVVRHLSS